MECPNCKLQINDDAKFCSHCGCAIDSDSHDISDSPKTASMPFSKCPHCGNNLRPSLKSDKYALCDSCQKKIYFNSEPAREPQEKKPKTWLLTLPLLVLFLLIGSLFVFLFGYTNGDLRESIQIVKDTVTPSSEGSLVKKRFLTVWVTVPKSLVELSEKDFDSETYSSNDDAVKNVISNSDGSVTVEIKRKDYNAFLVSLKTNVDDYIHELVNDDESGSDITDVKYNDGITKFDVYVDSDELGLVDAFSSIGFYLIGNIYQLFNGVPEDKINTVVNYISNGTKQTVSSSSSKEFSKGSKTESQAAIKNAPENSKTPETDESADMSGDYIGNIVCSEPPVDSSYTVYNKNNPYECIVLYIENVDNANIKFRLTKAVQDSSNGEYSEDLIFKKHIAHYNGSSYEYIGTNYHLFFQFSITECEQIVASDHKVSVYGLGGLFNQSSYGDIIEYNGINGVQFILNAPFAG